LPPPQIQSVKITDLIKRVTVLSDRLACQVLNPGDEKEIQVDPDQIEQVLINLTKNAIEASEESGATVIIHWEFLDEQFNLYIDDCGEGLASSENLFTPFFTTKPSGSGIGLTLSRQIIEGHNGSLGLKNHPDHPGCRATVSLPI